MSPYHHPIRASAVGMITLAWAVDAFIAMRCNQEGLHVEDVSAHCGLSPRRVAQVLANRFGMSFRARLRYHCLTRAKVLLANPAYSIKEVAAAVGYRSHRRLDEAFQAVEGVPPSMWRQRVADRRESNAAAHGPTQTGHAGAG